MNSIESCLEAIEAAQHEGLPLQRLLALRNAGEALAEALRSGPSVSLQPERGERLVLEREVALPALRMPFPFLVLERRSWRLGGLLIDPVIDGAFQRTPFGERFVQRHPLRARVLRGASTRPGPVDRIVLTSLRYQSLSLLAERYPNAELCVHASEYARYLDPSPAERASYERTPCRHQRILPIAAGVLAPGVVLLDTPGIGGGSRSVVVHHQGAIRVFSPHGVALDAWSPYESKLPGLRECLRLRDIEAVCRGDADPIASAVSMGLERAIADRRQDAPAFHHITPNMELVASVLAPISPTFSG